MLGDRYTQIRGCLSDRKVKLLEGEFGGQRRESICFFLKQTLVEPLCCAKQCTRHKVRGWAAVISKTRLRPAFVEFSVSIEGDRY